MQYCRDGDLRQAIDARKALGYAKTQSPSDRCLLARTDTRAGGFRDFMEESQVMAIFIQMLLSLHFCHTRTPGRQQVLHRDLKPENSRRPLVNVGFLQILKMFRPVLVSDTGIMKLADFGLSRFLSMDGQLATSVVGVSTTLVYTSVIIAKLNAPSWHPTLSMAHPS